MRYIKLFEQFEINNTFWESEVDGNPVKVTLSDVLDYLDNGFELDPNSISHLLIDVERDKNRIESADLSYPIILTAKGGKLLSILDGQHRVVKAIRDGVNIKARILDLDFAPENFKSVFK
jgi:hypothetical protein